MNNKYYKHSGKVPIIGLFFILIFASIAIGAGGFLYSYGIVKIPFIYINVFLTFGYGALVGIFISIGAKLGKIRNPKIVKMSALIISLIAVYVSWITWLIAISGKFIFFSHNDLIYSLRYLMVTGSWSIGSTTPKGNFLMIIWIIEALIIISITYLLSTITIEDSAFCEDCDEWTISKKAIYLEPIFNINDHIGNLESHNFDLIYNANFGVSDNNHTELILSSCEECRQKFYLTIKDVAVSFDKKGRKSESKSKIVTNLIINREIYDNLLKKL